MTTDSTSAGRPILVTGATGKIGSRVAALLGGAGKAVRRASRHSATWFDWDDPVTWPAALHGAGAVFVSYAPDLAVPGAQQTIAAFTDAAVEAGVERLVLLSGRGEPEAEACERIVRRRRIASTVLRCSWFMQNFSESFMRDALLAGELALPAGSAPEPFVDADDVAEAAVAALTQPGHEGCIYEMTGPRLWTFDEAVAEIARAAGRPLRYTRVEPDAYAAALRDEHVPGPAIELLLYLFTRVLDGRNARTADGVRRALGRDARGFTEYARAAAAAGAWDPDAALRQTA
jgi:uncharacterized protein YbjT (DUF2867 family)